MLKPQHEKRTLLLTALAAAGMVACVYALLGVWPFGGGSVLTGDLNGQYISYNAYFARALQGGGSLAYTFEKQMGGSMLGILAYYCASPLNLLYLLVPTVQYAKMAGLVLALKVVLAAVCMAFFLGRHDAALRHRVVLPALCYAFCAYMFIYAQNIMWMDVLVLLPLVCWGVELLVNTGRPFVFAVTLGVAIFANFYIAYMACIFVTLYFGWYMLGARRAQTPLRFWLTRCASFAFGALCAGGMACVLIVPAMADVAQNKGLASGLAWTGTASFKLTEFFYRLLPFNFTWADAENGLPNVYCGALTVVLAVVYFCAGGISRREKLRSAAMTLVLFLTLYSADAALALHGFVKPVWFPYRHAYLFSFWLCFLAARALGGGVRLTWPRAACAAAVCCGFLAVCFLVRNEWFTATLFGVGALLCGAYLGLVLTLSLMGAKSRRVRAVCLAAVGLLCMAELTANAFFEANQFEKYPEAGFTALVTDGGAALSDIAAYEAARAGALPEESGAANAPANGAYRVEKAWQRSYNDPMLLDYTGLSHFGSTQDSTVTMWLSHLGFGSTNAYVPGSTAFAESVSGLRYLFARTAAYKAAHGDANGEDDPVPAHYEPIGETQAGLALYENKTALPLAFAVQDAVAESDFTMVWDYGMCQTFDIQNILFALLTNDKQAALFTDAPITATADGKAVDGAAAAFADTMTFTAPIPADGLAYAVFESDSDNPVLLSGDVTDEGYFAGRSTGVLQLGRRKAGDTVTVTMTAEWGKADVSRARICVLDEAALAAWAQAASENAPQVTLGRSTLTAQTNAREETLYAFSVPYAKSLVLTVDGEETEILPLLSSSYCGVRVPAGQHAITFRYAAAGAGMGAVLTALSLLALCGAWLWLRLRQQPKREKPGRNAS